ncbi:MAG: hypothetical protein GF350_14130, partial [Chitinivibrionales bacterium]|nr:hypothetical protein [Chitinivibrionales bacterium]
MNTRILFILATSIYFISFEGAAVQLENWRLPYYRLAFDLGECRQSP